MEMHQKENIPIGVIGGGICTDEEYKLAEAVGKKIAQAGGILICGGMSGVMEAACKGAFQAGGLTVGILPTDSIDDANPYVKIPVATGMGIGRNIIIVRTAAALISIDGKFGTLSEISYALQLNKKVISLRPWMEVPGMMIVKTPEEAVRLAFEAVDDI
jgi:uncharacterized protein (TIGR00725 family)